MVRTALAFLFVAALLVADGYGIKPGRYSGTWTGQSSDGKIELELQGSDKTIGSAKVMFTYQGSQVTTKLRELKHTGGSLEITYEFELEGNTLTSALKGSLKEKKLIGTYRTTVTGTESVVDQGDWSASPE